MTTLTIGRLSATVHTGPEDVRSAPRVRTMLGHLAERGLDDALRAVTLPPGQWFVRRLDVALTAEALTVDDDRPGSAVESRWAAAVLDALRRALAGGSADVVHHRHPVDGLVELITALAAGRVDHAWVWRRAGLLQSGDPAPGSAPAQAVLAAVRRRPELACAALVAAVPAAGVPALHRLLGTHGWVALADLVRAAAGGTAAAATPPVVPVAAGPGEERTGAPALPAPPHPAGATAPPAASRSTAREAAGDRGTVPPVLAAPSVLAAAVLARSVLAEAFRRGRVRPDAEVALAWAALVVAEAEPGLLGRPAAAAVLREIAAVLAGTAPAVRPVAVAVPRPATARPSTPGPQAREDAPAVPTRSDPAARPDDVGAPTGCAGLLFLLATAEEAGVPDALLDDPALAGRPLRWILAALAPRLLCGSPRPPAPDDPAVLALAGLVPTAEPPAGPRPTPGEAAGLDDHARRWVVATARRLARPDDRSADGAEGRVDPADVVAGVCHRRGTVVAVPGWIELHLPLDDVDVDVRRAGLDLDPGWVPWLGAVVRYVYV